MKYHIYHKDLGEFLYWDEKLLEFDTEPHAQRFLESAIAYIPGALMEDILIYRSMIIEGDDEVFNATHYIVTDNPITGEEELTFVGP